MITLQAAARRCPHRQPVRHLVDLLLSQYPQAEHLPSQYPQAEHLLYPLQDLLQALLLLPFLKPAHLQSQLHQAAHLQFLFLQQVPLLLLPLDLRQDLRPLQYLKQERHLEALPL
jgi:hypothetical protein